MEYRNLGRSGLKVSVVGIGCNNFGMRIDADRAQAVVDKAIDLGINLFDTADIYGSQQSEGFLGKALGARRKDVVVATKFGMKMGEGLYRSGGSRRYIMTAVEDSLRRLGTDYIDLYQLHTPDADTPLDETMAALDDLVRQGKVRYVGHSNFTGWMTAKAHYLARECHFTPFISAQNEYNLLRRQVVDRELIPACVEFGVGILPYFPLASGMLTGKYHRGEQPAQGTRLAAFGPAAANLLNDKNFAIVEALENFAQERGHTVLELAISWLASRPAIGSVIAGATSAEQVEANAAAAAWQLDAAELAEIDRITR